jgi:hypothetical protein
MRAKIGLAYAYPGSYAGLRLDDGSDSHYIEFVVYQDSSSDKLWYGRSRYYDGSSLTETNMFTIYTRPNPVTIALDNTGTRWSSWGTSAGLIASFDIDGTVIGNPFSGASWTPTRGGLVFYTAEATPSNWRLFKVDMAAI